jgi:hypothetical protein
MLRFRRMKSLQKFASVRADVHNHFNLERHLYRQTYKERRSAAIAEWVRFRASRSCSQSQMQRVESGSHWPDGTPATDWLRR